ncbi:MAG TPA: prepilin-type N-terminal cleavage/methylation domain-containing protein [Myxococcaceae bacterium]|jgi:type IV pilus assembly protein PilV
MSPFHSSAARGFSLIEAMAALVVFTVGILGVLQMNVLASQQNNLALSHTTASKIARDLADSFERLPYTHPLFTRPSTLQPSDPDFSDFDNSSGLWTLQEAVGLAGARPLLGAADAIATSEGQGTYYQVAWRAQRVENPTQPGTFDSRRIVIMVRYPTPGGFRQVNVWAIKYDPAAISLGGNAQLEL